MTKIKDLYRTDDWKTEKHVPVIEVEKQGEKVKVKASIGKEISHPNETKHHIRWIELYFKPEGDQYPYQIGKYEFTAHGESVEGPDTSTIYTEPKVVSTFLSDRDIGLLLV